MADGHVDPFSLKLLVKAIEGDNASSARSLLDREPSLARARQVDGGSLLLLAAYHKAWEVAKVLLEAGAVPDAYEAAALGDVRLMQAALGRDGTRLDACGPDGWTLLHLASFMGQERCVDALLSMDAPLEARSDNAMSNTPLHAAAAGGRVATVERLIGAGAELTATYGDGYTALHVAAANGDLAMVRALIDNGCPADVKDAAGESPLDHARQRDQAVVVAFLEGLA